MLKQTILAVMLATGMASASTYYVDPAGSNGNNGLSPQTPWRTLLKVGISTFQPGDVILFKRDAVWNEWLTPPSSGTAGNVIKFDAYGNGRPPEFTGLYATTVGAMDEHWRQCLANPPDSDSADLATELCAVRDDVGKFSERTEFAGS